MYNVSCEEVTEGTPLLSKGRYFVNITSTRQIKVLKTINHSTTCEGCISPKAKIAPVLREKTVARNQTFNKLTCRSQILAYLTSNLIQRLVFWWRRGPGKRPSSATVCWAHFEGWSHTNTPSTQTILSNQLRFSPNFTLHLSLQIVHNTSSRFIFFLQSSPLSTVRLSALLRSTLLE